MERIVEINLKNKEDLFEKYNINKVSKDLINYIIDEVDIIEKNDTVNLIIDNKIKGQKECESYIIEGLKEEYNKCINQYDQNNIKQLSYLIIGILALLISVLIEEIILKEFASVGVWVLFWNVIEIELFEDKDIRKKKKIIKKLLNGRITEINNL